MNKDQKRYFNCQVRVQEFLNTNISKWEENSSMMHFKKNLDEIIRKVKVLEKPKADLTKQNVSKKEELKYSIAKKISQLSKIIQTYYYDTDNSAFNRTMVISENDIKNIPDGELDNPVMYIIKSAKHLLPELSKFSVTENQIIQLTKKMEEFNAVIGKPDFLNNASYNGLLSKDELIKEGMFILNNIIDNEMLMYKEKDKTFYDAYIHTRIMLLENLTY